MWEIVKGLLIGLGAGLIIVPIAMMIFNLIKDAAERRRIKKMIQAGKFLKPIDAKDYDVETWKHQFSPDSPEELERLNEMFKNKFAQKPDIEEIIIEEPQKTEEIKPEEVKDA